MFLCGTLKLSQCEVTFPLQPILRLQNSLEKWVIINSKLLISRVSVKVFKEGQALQLHIHYDVRFSHVIIVTYQRTCLDYFYLYFLKSS